MKQCPGCKNSVLEVFGRFALCEGCYRSHIIKPIIEQRERIIAELSECEHSIKVALEPLAKRVTTSNVPVHCHCGAKFSTGMQYLAHSETCLEGKVARATASAPRVAGVRHSRPDEDEVF